jgi:hypothetical protein
MRTRAFLTLFVLILSGATTRAPSVAASDSARPASGAAAVAPPRQSPARPRLPATSNGGWWSVSAPNARPRS